MVLKKAVFRFNRCHNIITFVPKTFQWLKKKDSFHCFTTNLWYRKAFNLSIHQFGERKKNSSHPLLPYKRKYETAISISAFGGRSFILGYNLCWLFFVKKKIVLNLFRSCNVTRKKNEGKTNGRKFTVQIWISFNPNPLLYLQKVVSNLYLNSLRRFFCVCEYISEWYFLLVFCLFVCF